MHNLRIELEVLEIGVYWEKPIADEASAEILNIRLLGFRPTLNQLPCIAAVRDQLKICETCLVILDRPKREPNNSLDIVRTCVCNVVVDKR